MMGNSPALLPVLLLVATRGINMLARLGFAVWQAFFLNSSTSSSTLKISSFLVSALPGWLMVLTSALALGVSANSLRMQRFENKSVGVALTALTAIAFIQVFASVFRVM